MKKKAKHKSPVRTDTPAEKNSDKTKDPTCSRLAPNRIGSGLAEPMDLRLLDLLIKKIIKRLEHGSLKPKVQDALKAIQLKHKLAPTSEAEQTFWQFIQDIKRSERENQNSSADSVTVELARHKAENLEAQLLRTIIDLKDQVKNGILPVKTITDTLKQGRSSEGSPAFGGGKESQSQDPEFGLTYRRIGQLLSTMGFRKAKTHAGTYAILWDDNLLSQNTFSNDEKNEKQPSASPGCPACPASS